MINGIGDMYKRGLRALDEERFGEARELLERCWRENPCAPVTGSDLALARFAAGDQPAGMALFDELLGRFPDHPFPIINRFYCQAVIEQEKLPPPEPLRRVKAVYRSPDWKAPAVSIVMCTYNRPEMIRESVESVLAQSFQDFELLVINDGGDTAVKATLEGFGDPRIVFIDAEHGGMSSALNIGLVSGQGKYIAYLDDDDIWYAEHLRILHEYLETHPGLMIAYTDLYRAYQEERRGRLVVTGRVPDFLRDFERRKAREQTMIPNMNAALHRRSLIEEIGLFKEDILHTMDWDYYLRISARHEIRHIRSITGEFRTRRDSTQMTYNPKYPRDHFRNLILYGNRLFPLTGLQLLPGKQGDGKKLIDELQRLLTIDRSLIKELELRKLFGERYYSIFYQLGKKMLGQARASEARAAFGAARRLAPFEPKTYFMEGKTILKG